MYLHQKFINRLIKLTEKGRLNWEKVEGNKNCFATPRHYVAKYRGAEIHVLHGLDYSHSWEKEHNEQHGKVIAIIIVKNKKQQTFLFNEVPSDKIAFDLYEIILHYYGDLLKKIYTGEKLPLDKKILYKLMTNKK